MTTIQPSIAFDVRPGKSGPGRYVASLVRGLANSEFRVRFVGEGDPAPPAGPAQVSASPVPRLPKGPRPIARLLPKAARQWLGFRREARRLAGSIRAAGVDLFHTQNTGCEEAPVAAKLAGVRHVLGTFHVDSTYDLFGLRSDAAHRALEWYSNRSLHRAIAVSEATKRDWVCRSGIPADRVVTIHNGIDPDRFRRRQSREQARAALGLPNDALIVGGLGRLDPVKGFADLIAAAARLRGEFPQLLVAIAGTGTLQAALREQASKLGVANRVRLLGFCPDVNLVLDACDVFAMPSLAETLGYSLLEAMAHELPAVGTQVGGIPEVIDTGVTGLLVPPRNPGSLAAALRSLLASSDLRARMGRAGRERVERHFQERDMIAKTLSVYRELLQPQRVRSSPVTSRA